MIAKGKIEKVREEYPVGSRIELIKMDDPQAPPIGTRGTVLGIDDIGSLLVKWDTGGRINVLLEEDECKKLTKICVTMEKKIRVSKEFEITPEELDRIMNDGENPFYDQMQELCTEENGTVNYDYAIADEDNQKTLVDWD